jgi:hypothetical protein
VNKTPYLIAAALLAVTAGAAMAQDNAAPAAQGKPRVSLDANKDGVIDRQEAAARPRLAERFDELDRNKDGKLQRDELPRMKHHGRHGGRGGHGGFGFAGPNADADKDGRISKAEALAAATAHFERMDVNKDGFIDKADREAMAKQHREAWFKRVDTDGDGKLSQAELDAAKAKRGERGGHRGHDAAAPAAKK